MQIDSLDVYHVLRKNVRWVHGMITQTSCIKVKSRLGLNLRAAVFITISFHNFYVTS